MTNSNIVIDHNGNKVAYNVAVSMMDDDIREDLAREMAPCSNQEFFSAYEVEHFETYGEFFVVA